MNWNKAKMGRITMLFLVIMIPRNCSSWQPFYYMCDKFKNKPKYAKKGYKDAYDMMT